MWVFVCVSLTVLFQLKGSVKEGTYIISSIALFNMYKQFYDAIIGERSG